MCELFCVSAKEYIAVNEYLNIFFRHSVEHPNGWGIAELSEHEARIEKEPCPAYKSSYLRSRLSVPLLFKNGFAHIRKATIGNIDYENCHPFTACDRFGRRLTLMHNGTIFDYPPIASYIDKEQGDTDSERILLYLIDRLNERELTDRERFSLFDDIISDMAKGNKLNLSFYDGRYTYVHTNFADSLYMLKRKEGVIFATTKLSMEDWVKVPFMRLCVFEDGVECYEGASHGNQYIASEEDLKYIYQYYSNL